MTEDTTGNWGLGLVHHKLYWNPRGGFLSWLPESATSVIMDIWNFVACKLYGHHWLPDWCQPYLDICTDCMAERQSSDPVGLYIYGDQLHEIRWVNRVHRAQVPWIWSRGR